MASPYEVIKTRVWKRDDGVIAIPDAVAKTRKGVPWRTPGEEPRWRLVTYYTVRHESGRLGTPSPYESPWPTRAEAQAWVDAENTRLGTTGRHHATKSSRTSGKQSSRTSGKQLDREIAEALSRSRVHATKRKESIWSEVGLEGASNREKAAFWREALLSDLDDIETTGVSSSLRPVLADVSEVVDPDVLRAFAQDQLSSIAASDYRAAVREIRGQILNASIGQIVQYATEHYRSLA